MKFGKYSQLLDSVEYNMVIDPEIVWVFHRAAWKDEAKRDSLFSKEKLPNLTDQAIVEMELWLTFVSTNLTDGDKPFIPEGCSLDVFSKKLSEMPTAMVEELHQECRGLNPHWDPKYVSGKPARTSGSTS